MKRLVLAAALAAVAVASPVSAAPPCTPHNTILQCVRDLIGPIGS